MTDTPIEPDDESEVDNDWTVEYTAVVENAEDAADAAEAVRNAIASGEVDCWVTPPGEYPVRVDSEGNVFAMTDEDMDPDVAAEMEEWEEITEEE